MRTVLKTALFMLGVLFFTGGACPSNETTPSNKVAQTEIYQSYSVTQNGANYDVTAYFRVGGKTGTTLALSAPSKVTFNGKPMEEHLNTTSGTFYTSTVADSTPNGTFAFTDRDSKTHVNVIDLHRSELAVAKFRATDTAPISIPFTSSLPANASLSLELNDQMIFVTAGPDDAAEAYYDRQSNSVVLTPAAWKKVASGNVKIDLDVLTETPTQQGTALGGNIQFKYSNKPLNVVFAKSKAKPSVAANTKTAAN